MIANRRWLAILGVVAAGCSSVKTEHPVSDHPEALDKEQLEGAWVLDLDDDEVILHLKFGDDNVGRLASLEWKKGEFRVKRGEFVVAHGGDGRYMSYRWFDDESKHYELVAYDFASNGDLIIRGDPTDAFARAVAAGQLRGSQVKKYEEVFLASPSDTLLSFLSSAAVNDLFGGTAFVLRRVTGP